MSSSKDAGVKAAIGLVLQGGKMETFSGGGTYPSVIVQIMKAVGHLENKT